MSDPLEIPLRATAIADPTGLDVATLAAIMLWPHDADRRTAWVLATLCDLFEKQPEGRLSPQAEAMLANCRAASLPRLTDLRPKADRQMVYGMAAGFQVLTPTLNIGRDSGSATIAAAQHGFEALVTRLWQRRVLLSDRPISLRRQTMNNKSGPVYPMRTVGHLWAAYTLFAQDGDIAFPCRQERLPTFLAAAEQLRGWAEKRRAPRAPHFIMRPGVAARLSDDVRSLLPPPPLEEIATVPATAARSPLR